MLELDKHPYFEKYTDPKSGVESYILTNKPAPLVRSFYFVNQSLSKNQKYLWVYCAEPPLKYISLAVIGMDAENPFMKYYPHAVFSEASPLVSEEGDSVYFTAHDGIYQLFLDGKVEELARLPEDYVQNRYVTWMGTHLTISADKKYMLIDGKVGNEYFVATMDMRTKEIKIIHDFGYCHNHAQFSPVRPDLFILDEDGSRDPVSGRLIIYNTRMWLININGEERKPVNPTQWYYKNSWMCHDFWSGDGTACWIDYKKGAYEMNVDTNEIIHVWKEPLCHAHCNFDRSLWCADENPYLWDDKPCKVMFFHRKSGKVIAIFSEMPKPQYSRDRWHIDPHPQFTMDGEYIVSTTTVREGLVDLAITPVTPILETNGLEK